MKKILTACFYLLLTFAVSSAGFVLPSALNAYQDRQIFAKIEHTAMEPLELTYSSSLFDTLRLLSQDHYFVDYPFAGSKRTEEEVYGIVSEMMDRLNEYEALSSLPAYAITNYAISPQLAILSDDQEKNYGNPTDSSKITIKDASQSQGDTQPQEDAQSPPSDITTAVVWLCSLYFDSGYWANFGIDDKSGKVVAFALFTEQTLALIDIQNEFGLNAFAESVAGFLQDYYELPTELVNQGMIHRYIPNANSLFEQSSVTLEAHYIIQLKEENGNIIQIPLRTFPELIVLN